MTPTDAVRAQAHQLAEAGQWPGVADLLMQHAREIRAHASAAALLAEALVRTGRAAEARAWLVDALPEMRRGHDRASLRRATVLAGAASFELGQLTDARRAFESTLELARDDGDDALVARAMNNLGAVDNVQGRRNEALANYRLAMSAHQQQGNVRGIAECCHNMAITYRDLGRLEEADELEQRCIEYARASIGDRLVGLAKLGRAELALRRGDPAFAAAAARRVATEFAAANDPVRLGDALRLAGVAQTMLGRFDLAQRLLDEALAMLRRHGATLNEAETLRARAELAAARGDRAAARSEGLEALGCFERLGAVAESTAMRQWLDRLAE
jgi:tetratricopeptide (TPR) repeat protein